MFWQLSCTLASSHYLYFILPLCVALNARVLHELNDTFYGVDQNDTLVTFVINICDPICKQLGWILVMLSNKNYGFIFTYYPDHYNLMHCAFRELVFFIRYNVKSIFFTMLGSGIHTQISLFVSKLHYCIIYTWRVTRWYLYSIDRSWSRRFHKMYRMLEIVCK